MLGQEDIDQEGQEIGIEVNSQDYYIASRENIEAYKVGKDTRIGEELRTIVPLGN